MSKENETQNPKKVVYKIINKEEKNKIASFEIEVPFDEVEKNREKALKILAAEIEIKGFRKGAAPTKMVTEHVGAMKVLEEMAYQTVVKIIPALVEEEKVNALTQPKISITKIAEGNPLTFKADFVLMPEIKIADYKKIAKETKAADEVKIEDSEVEEYIDYIRGSRAEAEALRKKTSADPEEREEANKKTEDGADKKDSDDKKIDLPEFNDDFVKTLGDFKNVEDFKTQLIDNMKKEKEEKSKQKRRLEIMEKIISESEIDLPDLMIEEELQRMLEQFRGDLKQAHMDFDEYLGHIKKTTDDLLKEWRPDAIKRTKMNLILPKIAFEEKIEANPEQVEHEAKHLKQHYPEIEDAHAKSYVAHMLRNDEVFKFLENIK